MDTFGDFVTDYHQRIGIDNDRYGWRPGQTLFNMLLERRPDLAEIVRGTRRDPFYHQHIRPHVWTFLEEHWDWHNTNNKGNE